MMCLKLYCVSKEERRRRRRRGGGGEGEGEEEEGEEKGELVLISFNNVYLWMYLRFVQTSRLYSPSVFFATHIDFKLTNVTSQIRQSEVNPAGGRGIQ